VMRVTLDPKSEGSGSVEVPGGGGRKHGRPV